MRHFSIHLEFLEAVKKYIIVFQVTSEDLHTSKRTKTQAKTPDNKQLLALACKYLSEDEKYVEESQIAKVWANKLKALAPQQRLFAEKAINDIFFEAALGNLNRNSVKINVAAEATGSRPLSADSWTSSIDRGKFYATNYVSTPLQSPLTQQEHEEYLVLPEHVTYYAHT